MSLFSGRLGNATVYAKEPVIARFKNSAVLEFSTLEEADGFMKFYNTNPTAVRENPGSVYLLESGVWLEHPEI